MSTTATLYERLGASQGIAALVDDIIKNHLENPLIKARFIGSAEDPERLELFKRRVREFLSAGSGGPNDYTGASMVDAHRSMNISAEEFMAATDDILNALKQHDIDRSTRDEVLGIVWSLKPEVMHL